MACGKPIVASLNGEGARIINASGAGIAAPASNPEALAGAVERMMDRSPEERAAYGRASLDYFRTHYSQTTVYDMLERSLEEAAYPTHRDHAERVSA
jgi:glycosyltransferase involved in cell wall biosynthesis